MPAGGESSFSYYLGGSFSPALCSGLATGERREVFVGSSHIKDQRAGATIGWRVTVCLSDAASEFSTQKVAGPVDVTHPDGTTFQVGAVRGSDCDWYGESNCDVLHQFTPGPADLGTWTVRVDLADPVETLEHSFDVVIPSSPSVIRASGPAPLLATGVPGSQLRIAALLARRECAREVRGPDEVCADWLVEFGEWLTVWTTEVSGPVIGPDGTAWYAPPPIAWPPIPDPQPGLPYDGSTQVCYAVIQSGSLGAGASINESDCIHTSGG